MGGLAMLFLDFREMRRLITPEQIFREIGWQWKIKTGDQVRGSCPLHVGSGKGNPFSVNTHKKVFQCFKCKKAGNLLELYALLSGTDFYTSMVNLSKALGLTPTK